MTIPPYVSTGVNGSRVLIVGATGFIGQFIVEASLESKRPTYVLVRSNTPSCTSKAKYIKSLQEKGAIILHGSIDDKEGMEKTLKEHEIDVVISAIGGEDILDQLILIDAMKSVGTVKRFLPSEFGHDVVRAEPVEPGLTMYVEKRQVRRSIEESGVPYTYICCNSIASWPYYDNTHPSEVTPPLDKFQIYGDGSVKGFWTTDTFILHPYAQSKGYDRQDLTHSSYTMSTLTVKKNISAYFVAGTDIGKFTMKAVDDYRTINKSVHFRPKSNCLNMNELASLWEKKICMTLPREVISEEDLLSAAAENCIPESVVASFTHDIFIKGCQVNFSLDSPDDLEACVLYPDESFKTMDECFDDFLAKVANQLIIKNDEINVSAQMPVVERPISAAVCA